MRLILNGKKAGLETVRSAVLNARKTTPIEVRVTWEHGDAKRLVFEAVQEGCKRLVIGGGDGSVNELVDALLELPLEQRPELCIFPLGTANDFATGCGIPVEHEAALELARDGQAVAVDGVKANGRTFINVASGGFGAQVTASTPVALKNFLGGGAYTLAGLAQAANFIPYKGLMKTADGSTFEDKIVVAAVCNGRQAGGGQSLAPSAFINDGMLDIVGLKEFPPTALPTVISELKLPQDGGKYVLRVQSPWVEWVAEQEVPINLDGEPMKARKIRFEVVPKAIKLVLPEDSPVISRQRL